MNAPAEGPRLRALRPDELDDEQRRLYEAIVGGRRASQSPLVSPAEPDGSLRGPFNPMLLSPVVSGPLQELGVAIRYGTDLTPRQRELAILAVGERWQSGFERDAHERIGREAGLSDAELAAATDGVAIDLADPAEATVLSLARLLARGWDVGDNDYRDAVAMLGEARCYELVVLVGYYSLLALVLRTFGDETPTGEPRRPATP